MICLPSASWRSAAVGGGDRVAVAAPPPGWPGDGESGGYCDLSGSVFEAGVVVGSALRWTWWIAWVGGMASHPSSVASPEGWRTRRCWRVSRDPIWDLGADRRRVTGLGVLLQGLKSVDGA